MISTGIEVVSCGANVPFADKEIFLGPTGDYADNNIAVIPDFIANCGMARVFAYLMSTDDLNLSDDAIFADTSSVIRKALEELKSQVNTNRGLSKKGLEIALNKLS